MINADKGGPQYQDSKRAIILLIEKLITVANSDYKSEGQDNNKKAVIQSSNRSLSLNKAHSEK